MSSPTSWLDYSLDSKPLLTIAGNITLKGVSPGKHNLTVYGNTTTGATAFSETIFFTTSSTETIPTSTIAIAAAASAGTAVAVTSLVYWSRRKR